MRDSEALGRMAAGRNFATTVLANAEATTRNVCAAMASAAASLVAGDTFLLAFSGHGVAAETPFGFQQSWCLYDTALVRFGHDGLDAQFAAFAPGVRVLLIANCCHSGARFGATLPTPPIQAHVVRFAACASGEISLDSLAAGRLSPFAESFIAAAGEQERGDIFALFERLTKGAHALPQLEIGNPRSEEFLRDGF